MRVADVVAFIKAREAHRKAKERGQLDGCYEFWDPIIAKYRFCSVRRNDDRVTKEVHRFAFETMGWRTHPELWFAFVVARLFNNEETLLAISDNILPFKPLPMAKILHARAKAGRKNFNAAYIVSTNGVAMNKPDYIIQRVLTPLWKHRKFISGRISSTDSLDIVCALLAEQNGFKTFMAAQVVADLKYASPAKWVDFHTFAASGPGSKRGLNVVMGREPETPIKEEAFRKELSALNAAVNVKLKWSEPLTAQDCQNVLCEYFKYYKVVAGIGAPKQLYTPYEQNSL